VQKQTRRRRYPRARTDLRFHSVGGRFLVRDGAGTRDNHLDFASALVLTYCDGRHHPDAIADAVAGSLDHADRDALRANVERILEDFADEGLVQ
jgi:coenzyme PQQ synthesis protein D (PqqD)